MGERFNKYIEFMDYGDAIYALLGRTRLRNSTSAFYFYEYCQDNELLVDCKTWEEVCEVCVNTFKGFSYEEQSRWL